MIVLKMEGGGGGAGRRVQFGWATIRTRNIIIWRPIESLPACLSVRETKERVESSAPARVSQSFCFPGLLAAINFSFISPPPSPTQS